MRLGIVSDIHDNLQALDQAIAEMGKVDELICAGDACYQFRFSNGVAQRLRECGARYVLGNHEDILLSPAGIRAQESERSCWSSTPRPGSPTPNTSIPTAPT